MPGTTWTILISIKVQINFQCIIHVNIQYPTFEIGTLHGKFAGGAFPDALVGANFQDGGSAGCISYGDDLEVYKVLQTDFTV